MYKTKFKITSIIITWGPRGSRGRPGGQRDDVGLLGDPMGERGGLMVLLMISYLWHEALADLKRCTGSSTG